MRVGVLISGRGSNMVALANSAQETGSPFEIGLVLSNRPEAEGLARARGLDLKTETIDHKAFEARETFDEAVHEALVREGIDLVCLAGFMRILSAQFIARWEGRLVNIHPSLLPSFPGLHVHEQALAAGVAISGCSVHFVTPELDAGPIIGQAAVPVRAGDTPATLAARVNQAEHELYPACLAALANNEVHMKDGQAVWASGTGPIAIGADLKPLDR